MIADRIPGSAVVLFSLSLFLSGFSLLLFPLMQTMLTMAAISATFGLFICKYIFDVCMNFRCYANLCSFYSQLHT